MFKGGIEAKTEASWSCHSRILVHSACDTSPVSGSGTYRHRLNTYTHTPSIALRHLPPKKDVVNHGLEFGTYTISLPLSLSHTHTHTRETYPEVHVECIVIETVTVKIDLFCI